MDWFTTAKLSDHQETTPEGFILVRDTPIARTGQQLYRDIELPELDANDDGWLSIDRPADEVFAPASMASFTGKPLTIDHPTTMVDPGNWNALAVGHIQSVRRGTGDKHDLLLADVLITAQRAIDKLRAGKRAVSVGYEAGYRQDVAGRAIQHTIRANHLALVDEGRCGARCLIHDGRAEYAIDAEFVEAEHPRDEEGKFAESGASHGVTAASQSFHKAGTAPAEMHGIPMQPYGAPSSPEGWEAMAHAQAKAAPFHEPPLPPSKGKARGAGVIVQEPDGRVWIVHPTNQHGGYKATFPKGTVDPGMSHRATALKEMHEESGLHVHLTGYAGDMERDTSQARYYFAERIGGTPTAHGWETEKVTLAPVGELHHHLNRELDHDIVAKWLGGKKPAAPGAPKLSTATMKKVGQQLGSNPGGQYEAADGKRYYVKQSKSLAHAQNEILASKLYALAGSPILDVQPIDVGGGKLGTATEWRKVEAFKKGDLEDRFHAQEHFATHAWLANWDAVGLDYDNQGRIDGKMHTLDAGGALLFRAQGTPKGSAFGNEATEWDSLRHPKNPQAHTVYGDMTDADLVESAKRVIKITDQQIMDTVDQHGPGTPAERLALAKKLIARRDDIASREDALWDKAEDGWSADIDYPATEDIAA